MDLLKCCFGCVTVIGCKSLVVRKAAFFPPSPAGYVLLDSPSGTLIQLIDSTGQAYDPTPMPWLATRLLTLSTARGSSIPCAYFQHAHAKAVILFCHGNSTDVGYMWNHMADLATQTCCSVFIFEYTGYGPRGGKASEAGLYADIRAAYRYLREEAKVPWSDIIVYGQSIGSALACDLASELPCLGVILHSPIASGLRIFAKKETKTPSYDIFRNVEKMPYIRCPIFIFHGLADQEVPIRHSEWLIRLVARHYPPWWVPDGGHNDIEFRFRDDYFKHLREFLQTLQLHKRQFDSPAALYEDLRPVSKTIPVGELPSAKVTLPLVYLENSS